jgi:predicted AAA+ superfamily ATPase
VLPVAELTALLARLEGILERVENVLPPAPPPPDWTATAFAGASARPRLSARGPAPPCDQAGRPGRHRRAKGRDRHERQFVAGLPANNVAHGLARDRKVVARKAMLAKYAGKGLRRSRSTRAI